MVINILRVAVETTCKNESWWNFKMVQRITETARNGMVLLSSLGRDSMADNYNN